MPKILLLSVVSLFLSLQVSAITGGPKPKALTTEIRPVGLSVALPHVSVPTSAKERRVARRQVRRATRIQRQAEVEKVKTDGLAIAALCCAFVGIFAFAVVLGPLAVVFGIISMVKINKSEGRRKGGGLAIAAIALGVVVTILGAIAISQL